MFNSLLSWHILSVWPSLFDFHPIATTILRVAFGLIIFIEGWHITKARSGKGAITGWLNLITGLLLFVGLYTQPAAAVAGLISLVEIWRTLKKGPPHFHNLAYHFLVLFVAIAFLALGPGILAIDLPL